jgi:hypothetical protein
MKEGPLSIAYQTAIGGAQWKETITTPYEHFSKCGTKRKLSISIL